MANYVFRVTWRTWIIEVVMPMALLAAVAVFYVPIAAPKLKWTYDTVFLGWAIYIGLRRGSRLSRMKIEVNDEGLCGRMDKTRFESSWADTLAVWKTTESKQNYLYVSADGSLVKIPLDLFPRQLRSVLESYLPPDKIERDSYKRLPGYETLRSKQKQLVWGAAEPLRADATAMKGLHWFLLVVFAALGAFAFIGLPLKYAWVAAVPGVVLLVILYSLLTTGPIEVESDGVTMITPLGRYRMKWEDIQLIETDHQGQIIVLRATRKCLPLPGPGFWSGKQKADVIDFFMAEVTERDIPVRETAKAFIRCSRNSRV